MFVGGELKLLVTLEEGEFSIAILVELHQGCRHAPGRLMRVAVPYLDGVARDPDVLEVVHVVRSGSVLQLGRQAPDADAEKCFSRIPDQGAAKAEHHGLEVRVLEELYGCRPAE